MLEAARVPAASLPVIDISGLSSPDPADRRSVAAKLRAACLHNGFFYISNHGIEEALVAELFAEAAAFLRSLRSGSPSSTSPTPVPIAAMSRCRARRSSPARHRT